jgi:cytochrome c heme-lyase
MTYVYDAAAPISPSNYSISHTLLFIPLQIPGGRIPASGRGNSDDGAHWINPTPAELFRALRRNKKIIDEEDAFDVAFIHSAVVDSTWHLIMEYEELHPECESVTLLRFEGKYGHHTLKSWFTDKVYGVSPFDRHDWYVDRCGKEVRYIIDYYSTPGPEGDEYTFDVRPDMTSLDNIKDRLTMTYRRYQRGEGLW